jgi:hypothetical protein
VASAFRRKIRLRQAIRAATPVNDFGLVDVEAAVVAGRETRRGSDRAVNVNQTAAVSTNQMVVVVAHPILETSRGSGGLNATDKARADQNAQRVVHRLERDGPDLCPDSVANRVGGDVWLTRNRPQNGQSLRGYLNTVLPKELSRVDGHVRILSNNGVTPIFDPLRLVEADLQSHSCVW